MSAAVVPDVACLIARADYESLRAAATFLCASAAMRARVEAFWTDAALKALVGGVLDDAPPSSTFGGDLRGAVERAGRSAGTTTELVADARALGHLRMLACSGAVGLFKLTEAEVLRHVDEIAGYPQFLELALKARHLVVF